MTKSNSPWSFNREDENLPSWLERADLCADSIAQLHHKYGTPLAIADIGCGDLKLKSILQKKNLSFIYTGYDLNPKEKDVVRLDIERDAMPPKHNVITLLGIIEYLKDLPAVLNKLSSHADFIILSHVLRTSECGKDHDHKIKSLGWKNQLTEDGLRKLLLSANIIPLEMKKDSRGKTFIFTCRTQRKRFQPATHYTRYAAITPYIIPPSLHGKKIVNVGDGFILNAIERLVGPAKKSHVISSRIAPTSRQADMLSQSPSVILAGANQLNDNYTIWPGLTLEALHKSATRFIPFGIGLHGEPGFTDGLGETTKLILRHIHQNIAFSSWRCPHTVNFLKNELPDLGHKFLMTGCPVTYDKPLLDGTPFSHSSKNIAVTVTERHDFWGRETAIIDLVRQYFPKSQLHLVLHQNYIPQKKWQWPAFRRPSHPQANPYQKLRDYAANKGFKIITPSSAEACMTVYNKMDMHIGSRLHAHLLYLSQAKRSFLVPIDGRSTGMAEFLGFPLCTPNNLENQLNFDFEVIRYRAQSTFKVMQQFIDSI